MPGNVQPLDQKFAIVREDRTPTDYFIRWAQQKQIDIKDSITAEQAVEIIEQYLLDHQLQEGSGIQITPSGNISDMPTIAADVQEILDQISTTRGAIIYRGLLGWTALAPGTAGQFLKTQGAGADPVWASGGGGGGAVEFLGRTAIAALANVDIPLPTGYDSFRIEFYLTPSVDNVTLQARVTDDNFATVKSGAADYAYTQLRSSASSTGVSSSSAANLIQMITGQGNAAGEYNAGQVQVINAKEASPTSIIMDFNYHTTAGAWGGDRLISDYHGSNAVLDGLRIFPSSGTLTGFVKVWGFTA